MLPNKQQTEQFLRNELKKKAQARGVSVLPEQATVNMAEVAKVKIKHETSRRQ